MKKRFNLVVAALLATSLIAGCANNNAGSQSSSSTSQAQTSNQQAAGRSKKKAKKDQSQAPATERLGQVNKVLRANLPGMLLPTNDGLGAGSDTLNARYVKNGNVNTVYYSVGRKARDVNDPAVSQELPFAVLSQTSNLSQDEISNNIRYHQPAQGLPTKDLGNGISATEDGAAGSTYLNWVSGKWAFVVRASNVDGQDPIPTAKQLIALNQKYGLPDTQTNSSVWVTVGYSYGSLNTVISWETNNQLYQLKAHSFETAFKLLASLK